MSGIYSSDATHRPSSTHLSMPAKVDPTYPLYPIASILAAAMLLLVLLTSFIRQSWNLGVAFLCFWLFFENLTNGINAVIWSDNADIKLYVYCDIVTHLEVITSVVKPMATLIITRRLYLITSERSVELCGKTTALRRRNTMIEWTLGLVIPVIVAGPFYYVIQQLRFEVLEGFGCENSQDGSILDILLLWSWNVVPPLISVVIYYPRVARLFYRQSREINHFLQSNNSVSRTTYYRIFALASIDILLTLPIGIANIILAVIQLRSLGPIPFYFGWTYDHTDWEPESYSYGEVVASGPSEAAQQYFAQWTSPVLAFAIFGLFGVTSEARASYWRVLCAVGSRFGWNLSLSTHRVRSPLGTMEFGERTQDPDIGSRPSYANGDPRVQGRSAGRSGDEHTDFDLKSNSDVETTEEQELVPVSTRAKEKCEPSVI